MARQLWEGRSPSRPVAQGADGRLAQLRRQQGAFDSQFPERPEARTEIALEVVHVGAVPEHRAARAAAISQARVMTARLQA